jgi:hypothetical protein
LKKLQLASSTVDGENHEEDEDEQDPNEVTLYFDADEGVLWTEGNERAADETETQDETTQGEENENAGEGSQTPQPATIPAQRIQSS